MKVRLRENQVKLLETMMLTEAELYGVQNLFNNIDVDSSIEIFAYTKASPNEPISQKYKVIGVDRENHTIKLVQSNGKSGAHTGLSLIQDSI